MTRVKVSKDVADFVRSEVAYLRRRNPHAARSSQIPSNARLKCVTFPASAKVLKKNLADRVATLAATFCFVLAAEWYVGLVDLDDAA
jgi:hypothetical protein